MIKLFLGNKTIVVLLLPLYLILYQLLNYFFGFYPLDDHADFGIWTPFIDLNPALSALMASFVVLFNSYGLNSLVNRNNFHEKNTYLVALIYIVLMSLFQSSYLLNGIVISHAAIILMIHQFFKLNQNEDGRKNSFNGFLLLGIVATLSPIYIITVPFLIVPVIIMRPFSLREIFAGILGLITPFIYYFSMSYLMDVQVSFDITGQQMNFDIKDYWFVFTSIAIFLTLGLISVFIKSRSAKIQTNKQFQILILFSLIFLVCALFHIMSFQQIDHLSFVLIPLSIFLVFAFLSHFYYMAASVLFYLVFVYSVIKFFLFLPIEDL